MDEKLKAQWIAALRSGNYTQGQGQLRRTEWGDATYCCLGVLCDISDKGMWGNNTYYHNGSYSSVGIPASLVKHTINVITPYDEPSEGPLPFTDRNGGRLQLSTLNDTGMSFDQIADVIEYVF